MFVKLAFENEEITLRARARTREMKRYIVSLPSEVGKKVFPGLAAEIIISYDNTFNAIYCYI